LILPAAALVILESLTVAVGIEADLQIVLLEGAEIVAATGLRFEQLQPYAPVFECAMVLPVNIPYR
jgi:hypothetical protein